MVQKRVTRAARVFDLLIAPLLLGAVAGVLLGASAVAYWAVQVVAVLGGMYGGAQESGWRPGLLRGALTGLIFGAAILATRTVTGWSDTADIGKTPALLPAVTAVAGALLAALGGARRARGGR